MTRTAGGRGAVGEVVEIILRWAQGRWQPYWIPFKKSSDVDSNATLGNEELPCDSKRIILLVGWFAFFVGIYVGSSYLLGGIDGLPPLPDRFKPIRDITEQIEYPAQSEPSATKKLRLAFGDSSDEVKKQKFKFEIEPRGLALAAQDVTIEKDGRAKLVPFSVAIFSKDKGDNNGENKFPRSHHPGMWLPTFDRPLKNISQMADRDYRQQMSSNIRIIKTGTSGRVTMSP